MPAAPRTKLPDQHSLDRLRGWRNRPQRNLSLDTTLDAVAKTLRKQARSVGVLGGAWQELAPAAIVDRTQVVGLARGVLTIRVDDAPAKFELDRWLRDGGETALVKRSPTTLTRVRLVM